MGCYVTHIQGWRCCYRFLRNLFSILYTFSKYPIVSKCVILHICLHISRNICFTSLPLLFKARAPTWLQLLLNLRIFKTPGFVNCTSVTVITENVMGSQFNRVHIIAFTHFFQYLYLVHFPVGWFKGVCNRKRFPLCFWEINFINSKVGERYLWPNLIKVLWEQNNLIYYWTNSCSIYIYIYIYIYTWTYHISTLILWFVELQKTTGLSCEKWCW